MRHGRDAARVNTHTTLALMGLPKADVRRAAQLSKKLGEKVDGVIVTGIKSVRAVEDVKELALKSTDEYKMTECLTHTVHEETHFATTNPLRLCPCTCSCVASSHASHMHHPCVTITLIRLGHRKGRC